MRIFHSLVIAVFLLSISFIAVAQQNRNSPQLGSAKGIVRDTANNYVLRSATISIYKTSDSTLYSYQITNNYGEFAFKNLPVNVPLKLEVSHIGYQPIHKSFTIPPDKNTIDFKTLIIEPRNVTLNDVVISVPPISMNGDTLEFNASAFKLDSNAVVEDMLREVPNITLWGDGTITVNGGEVKTLKVNGKAFFGGDFKIALQNIAKNALQKVQVYKSANSEMNPLDSTLEMNLKLKKGKDFGYFGKVGAGYGTNQRFETDASINAFSPKMQLTIVGASNNINKSPNNIQTLVDNSTFKGVGTNIDYQPDFRQSGINQPNIGGASFTYDFLDKPQDYNKNTLKAEYFLQNRNSDYLSDLQTTTTLNTIDKVYEENKTTNSSMNTRQNFQSSYERMKGSNSLRFLQLYNQYKGDNQEQTFRTAKNDQKILASTNNTFSTNNFKNKGFDFRAEYQKSPILGAQTNIFGNFRANYQISGYENQGTQLNITNFRSFANSTSDQAFNRKYDNQTKNISQRVDFEFGNLKQTFLGIKSLPGVDFSVTNKLSLNNNKETNKIEDLDTTMNNYVNNDYLTNQTQSNTFEETPGLTFRKNVTKQLSNRFHKDLSIVISLKQTFIYYESKSQKAFQNINRSYKRFLPDANISYSNHQYGEYDRTYNLSYSNEVNIPTLQQLAALTDSTNLYYLQRGNLKLHESVIRKLSLSYDHNDGTPRNPLSYGFQLTAGQIENNIVDSILIDNENRRTVYAVNANGNNFFKIELKIKKAFKLKGSELQFELRSLGNTAKNPGYTNGIFAFSHNLNTDSRLNIHFTYRNDLAFAIDQYYTTYLSKQAAFNTEYHGKNIGTTFSSNYKLTKKISLNTNITFNSSSSSHNKDINFTLWNMSAVYRFLKGNNAEFKFSALDILHQNTSVINYGSTNSFTLGRQNVLKQYFMTTFSYYPRQFGKKERKKQ